MSSILLATQKIYYFVECGSLKRLLKHIIVVRINISVNEKMVLLQVSSSCPSYCVLLDSQVKLGKSQFCLT